MYNLKRDPYETNNLLESAPRYKQATMFRERLMKLFRTEMVEADYPHGPSPPEADPKLFGNILSSGWCQPKT